MIHLKSTNHMIHRSFISVVVDFWSIWRTMRNPSPAPWHTYDFFSGGYLEMGAAKSTKNQPLPIWTIDVSYDSLMLDELLKKEIYAKYHILWSIWTEYGMAVIEWVQYHTNLKKCLTFDSQFLNTISQWKPKRFMTIGKLFLSTFIWAQPQLSSFIRLGAIKGESKTNWIDFFRKMTERNFELTQ